MSWGAYDRAGVKPLMSNILNHVLVMIRRESQATADGSKRRSCAQPEARRVPAAARCSPTKRPAARQWDDEEQRQTGHREAHSTKPPAKGVLGFGALEVGARSSRVGLPLLLLNPSPASHRRCRRPSAPAMDPGLIKLLEDDEVPARPTLFSLSHLGATFRCRGWHRVE